MLPKLQPGGFGCFAIRSGESDRPRQERAWRSSSVRRISSAVALLLSAVLRVDVAAQETRTTAAEELAWRALAQWGAPYRWAGADPDTGFDCSGLVRWSAREALQMALPRRAEEIAAALPAIAPDALRTGDLVFFNTLGRRFSHVGIYLGDGQFIHAPAGRGRVRVESMQLPYWRRRYDGARRLVPDDAVAQRGDERATPAAPSGHPPGESPQEPYGGP